MEDYPRTLGELERRLGTEEACAAYLAGLRWPGGFRCPACGADAAWQTSRGLWVCRECQRQTSVKAGTIFQDSRLGLVPWFRAIWWVCSQKGGVNALGLQRMMGWSSYQTAWACLHKLRRAMVRPGRDRLTGRVEVDETYSGAPHPGPRGRGALGKALIVVAAQAKGRRVGRIRMAQIPDVSGRSLTAFVRHAVEPGSLVRTDDWDGYRSLTRLGYQHVVVTAKEAVRESRLLPRVHLVVSLLKRWLMETHHGAVSGLHLDYYLDEFTFRFNRRASASRGKLFYRLLQNAVQVGPSPYARLVRQAGRQTPTG